MPGCRYTCLESAAAADLNCSVACILDCSFCCFCLGDADSVLDGVPLYLHLVLLGGFVQSSRCVLPATFHTLDCASPLGG